MIGFTNEDFSFIRYADRLNNPTFIYISISHLCSFHSVNMSKTTYIKDEANERCPDNLQDLADMAAKICPIHSRTSRYVDRVARRI